MYDTLPVTYEVAHNEPVHPDPDVAMRFTEVRLADTHESTCSHGCKVYGDPKSNVRVLWHNSNYGCRQ